MPPPRPHYVAIAPAPALAPWVACYWSIRADAGAPAVTNRVLPDGCTDVIVGIGGEARAMVVGTMRTALVVPLAGAVDLIGVRFRPGGALPFLDVPLVELTDARAPLDALWGAGADALAASLAESDGTAARVARLDRVLAERLRRRADRGRGDETLVANAVAMLRRARGGVGVRELAAALGVGERRLGRAFDRSVGLGPKAFARVTRFRHAVRAIERARTGHPAASWSTLALEAGYVDQSHLIREFRALAGVTPARWAAERRGVGSVQYESGQPA